MRIYNDLRNAGIQAIITSERNVDKAIELYLIDKIDNDPTKGCDHHN